MALARWSPEARASWARWLLATGLAVGGVAILPAFLLIVFGIIWLRDKAKGGYKPVKLTD